jgi:hypothetical protein
MSILNIVLIVCAVQALSLLLAISICRVARAADA